MLLYAGPSAVPYGLTATSLFPVHAVLTMTRSIRTYQPMVCYSYWLALLLIVSSVLIAASAWAIVLRSKRVAPGLALNWSTVIRDSPYLPMSSTGSFMDDCDRSRLMQDTRLMFGDGTSDQEVGHLAIRPITDDGEVERARKDRLYD